MGKVSGDFDGGVNSGSGVDDSERVHEWEVGLPNLADITPLCQGLIPARLLSAFNIKPEPYRTAGDVAQASEQTLTSLRGTNFNTAVEMEVVGDELDEDDGDEMSESKKHRRNVSPEDADSAAAAEVGDGGDGDEKAAKRARLVWTPQLHKRFVDVVAHLGIKNAVPKTIMQLMNVEGLTRENVASHLQKYRLYLKRQGVGNNFESGPSNSSAEEKSAAAAVESGGGGGHGSAAPVPMPMMPVPMPMIGNYNGLGSHHTNNNHHHYNYNHNHNHNQQQQYHHHHQHQQYSSNGVMQTGNSNKYGGSVVSYHHNHLTHNYRPHVTPGDK